MKQYIRILVSIKVITLSSILTLCILYTGNVYGQSLAEEWYSNRSYYCGEIVGQYNDSLYYMTYRSKSTGFMRYLGELYISEGGNVETIKDGWGIERLPSYLHFNYIRGKYIPTCKHYEYYIGDWKDNVKDGKGFFIRYNGKIIAGEWKNGYLKRKTIRKPTTEEIEYINKMKELIDNVQIQKKETVE